MSTQGSFTDGKLESQKQYLRQRFTDIGCKSGYAIYASYALLQIFQALIAQQRTNLAEVNSQVVQIPRTSTAWIVVEVRHTSSTAGQGLSDPAAGISTLNDSIILIQQVLIVIKVML